MIPDHVSPAERVGHPPSERMASYSDTLHLAYMVHGLEYLLAKLRDQNRQLDQICGREID